MIILGMKGGLGNQMFQYALGHKLTLMGKTVKYDISGYNRKGQPLRKLELSLFDLKLPLATEKELIRMGHGNSILGKVCRKGGLGKSRIYMEDIDKGYQPFIFAMDDRYLDGYWQSEKYFKDIRTEILNIYKMPDAIYRENENLLEEIERENSVSLHIRRGDYLDEQNRKVYGGICTRHYYKGALETVRQKMKDIKVYIFTDDPEWVKRNFVYQDSVVVEANTGKNNGFDLFLMSKCKANIIANSSFSWWGAWLNQNRDKIVIAPTRWFNNHEISDAICEDWIRIEG